MKRIILIIIMILPILAHSQDIIYQKWNKILIDNIADGYTNDIVYNSIDYYKIVDDQDFRVILVLLEDFDLKNLSNKNEKIAFWVNVYNIAAVSMIIKYDIPESIKDIGNIFKPVWKFDAIDIGGEIYSLDRIEHQILRSYGEPLIHFAIVCASLSCPDLLNQAYYPETVISQMEENVRNFLKNNSKGLKVDVIRNTIFISKIFKWFEDDFKNGIEHFIKLYADVEFKRYPVKYLDYNWELNSP
jgi:uncharacterized protein DUF547